MTRFGPRIEPITSPTPGGCANSYATDAGHNIHSSLSFSHRKGTYYLSGLFFFHFRYLQTLTAISAEKNSTIVFPLPMELMNAFKKDA